MASQSNFKEVLEENEKLKRPANYEKRLERTKWTLEEEEEKRKAEQLGQDYELKKSLDMQADELERKERLKASKKRGDPGFIDFEEASKRQYGRLVKQIKPSTSDESDKAYQKDSKEGVERMVQSVKQQIEVRSKRSRRRRFNDQADVDYINERNMRYNKKLERFYGPYTDEIKQNFERGTAL